jgi:hypothetical protein
VEFDNLRCHFGTSRLGGRKIDFLAKEQQAVYRTARKRLTPKGKTLSSIGASVTIRFDGSRCFRARHQDRPLIRRNGPREARAIADVRHAVLIVSLDGVVKT